MPFDSLKLISHQATSIFAYFAVEVTLHRALMRSFDVPNPDQHLRLITRSAARERFISAIDFLKQLKPEHLQSFWYFASKINLAIIGTFGSLLWATSNTHEECEFYRVQLAEYRWTLRVSSTAAEFMKFTVGMLDDSPVFMMDLELDSTSPRESSSRKDQDEARDVEMDNQTDIQDQMAQPQHLEYNLLAPHANWLESTASGIENNAALSWNNLATSTGPNETDAWILGRFSYNFENMPGGERFLRLAVV